MKTRQDFINWLEANLVSLKKRKPRCSHFDPSWRIFKRQGKLELLRDLIKELRSDK